MTKSGYLLWNKNVTVFTFYGRKFFFRNKRKLSKKVDICSTCVPSEDLVQTMIKSKQGNIIQAAIQEESHKGKLSAASFKSNNTA